MREISLHILDIVQNSIVADASKVEIRVAADNVKDLLCVDIKDNGRGMPPDMVEMVRSPFCTTRTTRKVGLGIPMLAAAAEMCEGCVELDSKLGDGTQIAATFKLSHIDRMPLGDITSTMMTLIVANPYIDMSYEHVVDENSFRLDMAEVRQELGDDVPIQSTPVMTWLKDYLNEGIAQVGVIS
jgi:hypothetical protein